MSDLQVVATIPATPEGSDTLRTALSTLVEQTRHEDGCLSYDLFESAAAPNTFVTVERWRDQAALDEHMRSPHLAEAFAAADGALAGEVAIHPLVPVTD